MGHRFSFNEKQRDHCATALQTIALAQFGAFGFVGYEHQDYLLLVTSGIYFFALEAFALALLYSDDGDSSRNPSFKIAFSLGGIAICLVLVRTLIFGQNWELIHIIQTIFKLVIFAVAVVLCRIPKRSSGSRQKY